MVIITEDDDENTYLEERGNQTLWTHFNLFGTKH